MSESGQVSGRSSARSWALALVVGTSGLLTTAHAGVFGVGPNSTTIPSTGQALGIAITAPSNGSLVPIPPGTVQVSGDCTIGSVPGQHINVLYVIDLSGSTDNPNTVDANGDGIINAADDFNGDGEPGETLDGEIAGVLALNTSLGNPGNVSVGVVGFASNARAADASPLTPNTGTVTQFFASGPQADVNGNNVADIVEVLRSLRSETASGGSIGLFTPIGSGTLGNNTNFSAALSTMNSALTHFPAGRNIVFFLSDGESNTGGRCFQSPFPCNGSLNAAVTASTVIHTVGIGAGADPQDLSYIATYPGIGGTFTAITNPSQLSTVLPTINPQGLSTALVNGLDVGIDPLGHFSRLISCADLDPFTVTATCVATDGPATSISADVDLQCYRLCGDNIVGTGEECDPPGTSTCDADCQRIPLCGDSFVDAPEQCDPPGPACSATCRFIVCGNGVTDPGEGCDDGNSTNGDGCDNNCTPTSCGNGILTAGELCDDGNLASGDGCDSNCTTTGCGNGVVTAGELCDDGNVTDGDGCDSNCTATACGNTIVTTGELCDDGNTTSDDGCDANCTPTGCGNGITTTGEVCDDGNVNSGDGCDANCTTTGCGNGIVTSGEQCDDGNTIEGDGCTNACETGRCGNGFVEVPEECDDGNVVDTDGCRNDCTRARCGNGVVEVGEQCDEGSRNSELGLCSADCQANPRAYCASATPAYVRKAGFKKTLTGMQWITKGDVILGSSIDPGQQTITIVFTQTTSPDEPVAFLEDKTPVDMAPFTPNGARTRWGFFDRSNLDQKTWNRGKLRIALAKMRYAFLGKGEMELVAATPTRIRQSIVIGTQCWEAVLSCTVKKGTIFRCKSTGLPFN